MQKLHLEQTTKQKLSPQQIQSIALLKLSQSEIQDRITKELGENPALEQDEGIVDNSKKDDEIGKIYEQAMANKDDGMKYKSNRQTSFNQDLQGKYISNRSLWQEDLLEQLACLPLEENDYLIGEHIIGSIDADGYMRRSLEAIVDDMALIHYIYTDLDSVKRVLDKIQSFDPAGIAARSVQECLLLQLKKKSPTQTVLLAKQILTEHFLLLKRRHYKKIMERLHTTHLQLFKDALVLITKLTPSLLSKDEQMAISLPNPDFVVSSRQGPLQVMLYKEQFPTLKISKSYANLLLNKKQLKDSEEQEALGFVKKKITRAQWFIEAINQRKKTLLRTMKAIVDLQKDFFEQGEESLLKPVFLRDVADKISMDVSTISRVVSQKAVQTDWKIYPLKYFFSEPIHTTSGKEVSSRVVKSLLLSLIRKENKLRPYSDILLAEQLRKKGYLLARRTVSKYREQLKVPVARLRKSI